MITTSGDTPLHLLVVEDDPQLRILLRRLLSRKRHLVELVRVGSNPGQPAGRPLATNR
jgi:DNA-binding response OmpR family regulator